jgi:tetratricopeptide (TPR) repeat protein
MRFSTLLTIAGTLPILFALGFGRHLPGAPARIRLRPRERPQRSGLNLIARQKRDAMRLALLALLAAAAVPMRPVGAQAHHHDDPGPRPATDIGRVTFPISCSHSARLDFERGMALLHSFWYEEAGKAFRAATAADSGCSMAHWGHAMSLVHQLWDAPDSAGLRVGLEDVRAARAPHPRTVRERDYVTTIAAYFDYRVPADADSVKSELRLRAYGDSAAALARRYPKDDEAQILHALAILANADYSDTTFAAAHQADAILFPLFRKHPRHPGLAHYLIHANDEPSLAALALDAARTYATIAPAIPHAQHMPSHIFIRVGAWDETIASNRLALASGAEYEHQEHMEHVWFHNLHTMDLLQYAYLQEGRDREAAALADTVFLISRSTPPEAGMGSFFRVISARQALELGNWTRAAALEIPTAPDSGLTWSGGIIRFARGLGAARLGDTATARGEMAAMDRIARHLTEREDTASGREVTMERTIVAAWVALASGDTAAAVQLADAAASQENAAVETPLIPARELQGEMLLALGRGAEAKAAFAAALRNNPNRARSLFGFAQAAAVAGDTARARESYTKYLALMAKGDGTRPELDIARKSVTIQ